MTITVHRSFLLGATAGEAVTQERNATADLLAKHKRYAAEIALVEGGKYAFADFFTMRSLMLAGGLHRVRLTGGRSIDR